MFELLSQNTKSIKMNLRGNVEESVELNRNTLCVYELSKGCNSGMTENINLGFSGNDKRDDQLTKKAAFARYYCQNYYCFYCYNEYYYYYYFCSEYYQG